MNAIRTSVLRTSLAGLALTLAAVRPAAATPVVPIVEYATAGTLSDSRPFTLGYEFSTSTAFTVNALGFWDDGLGNNHQVGLWDSTGTLLTSTTVLGTDAITGHFRYHDIGSFLLNPGTYVIGGEFLGNGNLFPFQAQGVVSLPGYRWIEDRQLFGAGLNFPTVTTNGGYGNNGIFMVDLSVGAAAIPEPASMLLLGTGLIGLASRKRLRRAD